MGLPGGSVVKNLPAVQKLQETWVRFLGQESPLEDEMATHYSILAWRISGTEDPGKLQSMGLKRDTIEHSVFSDLLCSFEITDKFFPFPNWFQYSD